MATQIFQKSWRHLKFLDARWVTRKKFQIEDQQILDATTQNCHTETWCPGCAHPSFILLHKSPCWAIFIVNFV